MQLILHDVAGGQRDQLGGEDPPQRPGWDGDAAHCQVPTHISYLEEGDCNFLQHDFEDLYASSHFVLPVACSLGISFSVLVSHKN